MVQYRFIVIYLVSLCVGLFVLFLPYIFSSESSSSQANTLRVLTYSSFVQDWGPGPEVARLFEKETGMKIEWINAGNAGLLLERLKFKKDIDKPDVVLGFDQFSVLEARKVSQWLSVKDAYQSIKKNLIPKGAKFSDFLAYDWGPMTFLYREGELSPPRTIDDLLKKEYQGSLILQDPRMSSPGLQFLFWILNLKGEKQAFEFLKKLKKSIKIMAPSWSSAYSIFKIEPETMVFSYYTSSYFHKMEEKKSKYRPLVFEHPHPLQVEYSAIPSSCFNCDQAKDFLKFLVRPEIQKIIMKKNFMFPVEAKALKGSVFVVPEVMDFFDPVESWSLIRKKKKIINRWKKVFY